MAKQGRKTKLNEELSQQIIEGFARGNYATVVADYVGISAPTLHSWVKKGEEMTQKADSGEELTDEEQLFSDFFIGVKKAKALSEMRSVEVIRQASQTSWQAAAWYLERTANDRWGKTVRTEVTGADGGAIEISTEALNRKIEAMLDRQEVIEAEVVPEALSEAPQALNEAQEDLASLIKAEVAKTLTGEDEGS